MKKILVVIISAAVLIVALEFQAPSQQPESSFQDLPAAAYERQEFHLQKRLPKDWDFMPMDVYREAEIQSSQLQRYSTRKNKIISNDKSVRLKAETRWEWLGPGNIGGRTRSLVFHPNDSRVMFAGGVSGGVWKTSNAGEQWYPVSDSMANVNIGALVIDPQETNTLYAGTGELYRKTLRPYSSMSGAGIFKSIDAGETWIQLSSTVNENFLYVSDLVISPHDNKRVYAATNTGVWKSVDGGITFEQAFYPNDGMGNELYEGCNDLSIRTDKPGDWLLVSCSSRSLDDRYYLPGLLPFACDGPCDASIYVNTQAESSDDWQLALTEAGMGRTQMSIHQANQDIIYASSANTDGGPDLSGDIFPDLDNGLHAIFRSDDGGLNWSATLRNTDSNLLNTQLFSYADGALNSFCGGSNWYYSAGWYNQAIAVSPTDPNVVWVGGMEIYRSDDGGRNFGMASHWDAQFFVDPIFHDAYVHADQHSLIFHPEYDGVINKTLFATNDGGIYYTEDDSESVKYGNDAPCVPHTDGMVWKSLNNNYGVTQFYSGAVFPSGNKYLAGAQDNGTLQGSDLSGTEGWFEIMGGDGTDLAINPNNVNNYYVSWQNANIMRTDNRGSSWTSIRNGLSGGFIFVTPFVLDPNNTQRVYVGGQVLWRSDNQGNNWEQASPNLGNNFDDLISALAVAPGNSSHVLFANNHSIYVAQDALNFSGNLLSSSPRAGWVSSLSFEPGNSNIAYATYSTFGGVHVWKSVDGGETWVPLDGTGEGQLPDVPVHSLAVNPLNHQNLYIGTDLGVFVSLDGGLSWAVENTGFSQVITERLAVSEGVAGSDPYLFAFTYGRGVWRVPLADLDGVADYQISAETSGLWYDPDQSGHGLQLEVIGSEGDLRVFMAWYSYLNGQPVWIYGAGDIVDNTAVIDAQITSGTGFPGVDFDQNDVNAEPWGQLIVSFNNDTDGQLSWSSSHPSYNNGSMKLRRLTRLSNDTSATGINACHSGSWFNDEQSGHGFMVEVLESEPNDKMVMTWFTYVNGQQYWILANGSIENNLATMTAVAGTGGNFPPLFNPDDVSIQDWGSIQFQLNDDENATISWQSELEGFASGSTQVGRLTRISGLECD